MRYCTDDTPRTRVRNVNLNTNNTSKNFASNKMFHPYERSLSFIFKQKEKFFLLSTIYNNTQLKTIKSVVQDRSTTKTEGKRLKKYNLA